VIWSVAAPFFRDGDSQWIDDFVPPGRHSFRKIAFPRAEPAAGWHGRVGRATPISGWTPYWQAAGRALGAGDGVITVFPQLALAAALRRKMSGVGRKPIVAWCFNLGRMDGGPKRAAAAWAMRRVDRFVVHSTAEVDLVADYLRVARERVRFVPLQRAPIAIEAEEDRQDPFLVSMGSANRDYATLAQAARQTGLPLVIVAAPRCLAGIDFPANVSVRSGLSPHECQRLAQRARASIVPLADVGAASGQVTVIEAQRMNRAVIATRSIGTVDYIRDGETGLLVAPGDADAMAQAMLRLWRDDAARARLGTEAGRYAAAALSDEAAAAALAGILDEVAAEHGR